MLRYTLHYFMRVKREFQIYKKTHRSGNVSWLVNAGNVDGKRHLPAFKTRDAAEHYRARFLEREALQSPATLSDLTTLAAASVRLALERLEPYEASLLDASITLLSSPSLQKVRSQSKKLWIRSKGTTGVATYQRRF